MSKRLQHSSERTPHTCSYHHLQEGRVCNKGLGDLGKINFQEAARTLSSPQNCMFVFCAFVSGYLHACLHSCKRGASARLCLCQKLAGCINYGNEEGAKDSASWLKDASKVRWVTCFECDSLHNIQNTPFHSIEKAHAAPVYECHQFVMFNSFREEMMVSQALEFTQPNSPAAFRRPHKKRYTM